MYSVDLYKLEEALTQFPENAIIRQCGYALWKWHLLSKNKLHTNKLVLNKGYFMEILLSCVTK